MLRVEERQVALGVAQDDVMDAAEVGAALPASVAVRVGALPDDFVAEVALAEQLIEDDLHVMGLLGVQMQVQRAVLGQQLGDEDQAAAQELHKRRAFNLVSVRALVASAAELALGCERRVDVAEADALRAVSIAQLASAFHLHERLEDLEVVAEDKLVRPLAAGRPELLEALERNGHGVRKDTTLGRLGGVVELVFLGLPKQERAQVLIEVPTGLQPRRQNINRVICQPRRGTVSHARQRSCAQDRSALHLAARSGR